jgi:Protein of unknown function (DUF1469).
MISDTNRSPNPAGHVGLVENLLALARTLTEVFESRFALFAQESKAALVQLLVLAACSIFALVFCVLGYVFLIASGIVGLAHLTGVSWVWTALAAAGAHFVTALILLLVGRSQMTKPVFRATLTELTEDREWVKNLNSTSQPTS